LVIDVRRSFHHDLDVVRDDIVRLAGMVTEALAGATQALLDGDLRTADDIIRLDDTVDTLHASYIAGIFETHGSGKTALQSAVQLALVGRYYERIGDHAVNIGERVVYMVTGWMPEHTGAARLAASFGGVEDFPLRPPSPGSEDA
jgi:phosphate transport system protein